MLVSVSADALHVSRLMLDTPAHEGDKRDRAKVQGGPGSDCDGRTVTEAATDWAVSRKTLHAWLARYEIAGLDGLSRPQVEIKDRR